MPYRGWRILWVAQRSGTTASWIGRLSTASSSRPPGVVIFKNVTEWELLGVINGEKFHAVRSTLDEIFRLADEQIRLRVPPQTLRALTRREADTPVTAEQRRVLKRIIAGISFDGMTRSDANELIHARLNVLVGRPERV